MTSIAHDRPIDLAVGIESMGMSIEGDWTVPLRPRGAVLILNGAGNSRFGRRNRQVARALYDDGFATLLLDLLSQDEEREDGLTGALRLDVDLLAGRVASATHWVMEETEVGHLPIGYLASGVASAAALVAASRSPGDVNAIVSHGGRPDLAGIRLHKVEAPTLLVVGAADTRGIELNRWTLRRLNCEKGMVTVPNATHRLDEPGALDAMGRLAGSWFKHTMKPLPPLGAKRSILSIDLTERPLGGIAS